MAAARMTGMKLARVYSIITTSRAKMTPASGVLKDAAMPAAVPQPTRVRMLLFGSDSHWPMKLPLAAPRNTWGPSRPTEWPLMMATAAPSELQYEAPHGEMALVIGHALHRPAPRPAPARPPRPAEQDRQHHAAQYRQRQPPAPGQPLVVLRLGIGQEARLRALDDEAEADDHAARRHARGAQHHQGQQRVGPGKTDARAARGSGKDSGIISFFPISPL